MELADYCDRTIFLGFPSSRQVHRKNLNKFLDALSAQPSGLCCFDLPIIVEQGKKNKKYFWVPAIAPLISVILSTFFVFIFHAEKHDVQIVSF